jgi:hypothetical protein
LVCAAGAFGQQRHRHQGDRARRRRQTKPGVDEKADGQEYWNPRHIEDGNGTRTHEEGADLIEVADRLRSFARVARNGKPDHGAMYSFGKSRVEQRRRHYDHRASEHQQIHDAREQGHSPEHAPALAQGRREVNLLVPKIMASGGDRISRSAFYNVPLTHLYKEGATCRDGCGQEIGLSQLKRSPTQSATLLRHATTE